MGSLWEGIRKAATNTAANAKTAAENALRRHEIQTKITQQESQMSQKLVALGRDTYNAVRGGAEPPSGVTVDVAGISAIEAQIEQLKVDLAAVGTEDPHSGTQR